MRSVYSAHTVTLLTCSGWLSTAFSSHTTVHLHTILCCGKHISSVHYWGISDQSTEQRNAQHLLKLKTAECNALADNQITTFVITYERIMIQTTTLKKPWISKRRIGSQYCLCSQQYSMLAISGLVLGKLSQPAHAKFPIRCSKEVEILS